MVKVLIACRGGWLVGGLETRVAFGAVKSVLV